MSDSDPVQSPKNTVLERLKITLAVLITDSEFIPITNVVQRHDRYFEPSIEYIMSQRGFHNYVQLFECFPNSFKLSDDQQSVTFLRTTPPQSVLPYTHNTGCVSNIKQHAWMTSMIL
uniref:HTH OST-type domain-containing protein n=1 Tax=Panagrolaimus sp. PS1159 TaxID=55785 RepID=A0AC35GF08_9BILA